MAALLELPDRGLFLSAHALHRGGAGRDGGAITAGAFLGKFTKGLKWAHMDIAGTAYLSGAQKGSTGRPISLLSEFLIQRAAR